MVHPDVREAYRQEMECLIDRIYELNKPRKHHFQLRKL